MGKKQPKKIHSLWDNKWCSDNGINPIDVKNQLGPLNWPNSDTPVGLGCWLSLGWWLRFG